MEKRLQRKRKDNRGPPSKFASVNSRLRRRSLPRRPKAQGPGKDRHRGKRGRKSRGKTRCEIALAKNLVTGDLPPIGEGRLIEAEVIVEVRHDVVAAFDHLSRRFGEAWLVAIDQRQIPRPNQMEQDRTEEQQGVIADCGFQVRTQNSVRQI